MDKRDLDRLWTFPWFDRGLRMHYGLDPRRHLRYDGHERVVYYIIRRSAPRSNGLTGRFACDAHTLDWLLSVERHGRVENACIVLVEDWKAPPRPVYHATARGLWEKLERVVPFTSMTDESEYWWLDDSGEPQDVWLGPVLKTPPF